MYAPIPAGAFRKKNPTIQREFRGINKLDPFSIAPQFATECKNLSSRNYPALSVRPGYSVLGTYGTKVLGMGIWKETELHVVFNDGTWRKYSGGTWTTLASGLSTTAEWTFTNFIGNLSDIALIGVNGTDTPRYYTGGSSLSNLSGVPSGAKYITQYADRLWAVVGSTLYASEYRVANNWTNVGDPDESDPWNAVIESPDGENISGLSSGFNKLMISKPSATFKLMGYSPVDYEIHPVSYQTGQFNNQSAETLDGIYYQLFDSGFYRYPGGGAPESDFSERIKDYFESINTSGKTASCIGTDGRRIYISIPINSSTPDTIIEYDPKLDAYYPWEGISALFFARIDTTLYIGDASGRVLQLGGTTDNGTAISWNWVSKPFTGNSMAQTIRWLRMWETVDLPTGSTLSTDLSKYYSGDNWESVGSVTASTDVQRKAIYVASTKVANAKQIRYRLSGTGYCSIHEVAREEDYLPLI